MNIATLADRSDDELLTALRHGNLDAYGELWVRYERNALGLARRLTRNGADDIVAEAFARILRVVRSGKGPDTNFHGYLSTTVRSLIIDASRVKSSAVVPIGDQTVLAYLSGSVPGPDERVAGPGADADLAAAAWESLSERDRSIMWASAVDGYSTAEIAAQLGVSTGKAAVWVHRARERIRDAFLAHHAPTTGFVACDRQRRRLRSYLRGKLSDTDAGELSSHLDHCHECTAAFANARTVNERIRNAIVPIVPAAALPRQLPDLGSARLRAVQHRHRGGARHAARTGFAGKGAATTIAIVSAVAIVTIPGSSQRLDAVLATRPPTGVQAYGEPSAAASLTTPSPTPRHLLPLPQYRIEVAPASTTPRPTRPPRTERQRASQVAARPPSPPPPLPTPPAPPARPAPNLLAPSGFESFVVPDGGDVVCRAGTTVAGWTAVGRSIDVAASGQLPPPAGDPATTRVVDLIGESGNNAAVPDGIERSVVTTLGKRYRLTFALAGNPWNNQGVKTGEVRVNGSAQLRFSVDTSGRSTTSAASMGWVTKTVEFVATSPTTTISLLATSGGTPAGPVITDVTLHKIA